MLQVKTKTDLTEIIVLPSSIFNFLIIETSG